MKLLLAVALVLVSVALFAQTPPKENSPTVPNFPDANPDVLQLVLQDQWDRGNDMFGDKHPQKKLDWNSVAARDEERHIAIHKLLAGGKVKSGRDYWLSAVIFQHSSKPEDLMLAHVLAVTAAAKGNINGKFLAAATLDRYLLSINQPQVFETNYLIKDGKWTMEPYARGTLSDDLRAIWCVVPLVEQEKVLRDVEDGKPQSYGGTLDCK